MRLRTTLLGLLVVIAVVLSGTIYAGFAMHKEDVVAGERGEVERTAAVVAERTDTRLEGAIDTVDLWSTKIATDDQQLNTFSDLKTFVDHTSFDRAETYDRSGRLRYIVGPSLGVDDARRAIGFNYSAEPFFQRALAGDVYVGQPRPSVTGDYVVQIATPITDPDGAVVGVFSGTFEMGNGSLLGDVGTVGTASDHVTIVADNRTLFEEGALEGDRLTANATVPRTGWTVSVSRPRSAFAEQLRTATILQLGGVAVGLLAVAVVGLWISRTTLVHVRRLLDAFAGLESGEYRTDLELGRAEEWQQLSEQFNAVSATLEQRDSQLRVLNRVLRHNLRNDMNVITARAERILAKGDVSGDIEDDVERIHATATRLVNTSDHARTLYEDLLDSPKRAIGPVEIVDIVRTRADSLAAEFPDSTIEVDAPADAWALDSSVLAIVLEELFRNALRHNDLPEADRRVTVTVEPDADPVAGVETARETRVVVADNGPGIPMVEEALLTDQLEETPVEHGSGLGVWLVNWLVDRIGGTVSVTTGVDRGTTVTVHLPALEEQSDEDDTVGAT